MAATSTASAAAAGKSTAASSAAAEPPATLPVSKTSVDFEWHGKVYTVTVTSEEAQSGQSVSKITQKARQILERIEAENPSLALSPDKIQRIRVTFNEDASGLLVGADEVCFYGADSPAPFIKLDKSKLSVELQTLLVDLQREIATYKSQATLFYNPPGDGNCCPNALLHQLRQLDPRVLSKKLGKLGIPKDQMELRKKIADVFRIGSPNRQTMLDSEAFLKGVQDAMTAIPEGSREREWPSEVRDLSAVLPPNTPPVAGALLTTAPNAMTTAQKENLLKAYGDMIAMAEQLDADGNCTKGRTFFSQPAIEAFCLYSGLQIIALNEQNKIIAIYPANKPIVEEEALVVSLSNSHYQSLKRTSGLKTLESAVTTVEEQALAAFIQCLTLASSSNADLTAAFTTLKNRNPRAFAAVCQMVHDHFVVTKGGNDQFNQPVNQNGWNAETHITTHPETLKIDALKVLLTNRNGMNAEVAKWVRKTTIAPDGTVTKNTELGPTWHIDPTGGGYVLAQKPPVLVGAI